jgi:hypothetical protein
MQEQEERRMGWPKKKKYVYLDKYEEKVAALEKQIATLQQNIKRRDIFFACVALGIVLISLLR